MEGALSYLIGPLLIVAGLFAGLRWWTKRHQRSELGILPLYAAGIFMDEKGQPASIKRVFQSFAAAWQLYLALALLALGSAILISGV